MRGFESAIEQAKSIAIGGHVRPDGDCIGSCMGLYAYLSSKYKDKKINVFLQEFPHSFDYLYNPKAFEEPKDCYDLFISLDCGDEDRLGESGTIFEKASHTINIDHHISNTKFARENLVKPNASSTSEIVYTLMDDSFVDYGIATAIYTGIIHDTGVFKHDCTKRSTMEVAGKLMEKGIPFGKIIDESFYMKTFSQLQILGRCLLGSMQIMDGKCIFSVVTKKLLDFYEVQPSDLDGVIDQMRTTEGVEVAILLDERDTEEFKVSMRSNGKVNVSTICQFFGGGGHVRAAGCCIKGSSYDVINNLTEHIEKQLGKD